MSEANVETKPENNVDQQETVEKLQEKEETAEAPAKRGRKAGGSSASKRLSSLAKEAEAILKGFNDKDDLPEGRRSTRSSTRGSIAPVITPPPAKKERKSSDSTNNTGSSGRTGRRGRPKRSESDDTNVDNDPKVKETNNVTENDVKTQAKSEENGGDNVDENDVAATTKIEENAKEKMEVDGEETSKVGGSNDDKKERKPENEEKSSSETAIRTSVPESEKNHCEQNDKINDITRTEETDKSASVIKSSPSKEVPVVEKSLTGESNSANGEEAKSANTNSSAVEVSKD